MESQLIDAVRRNDVALARQLLARGADADARDRQSGLTVLMMAAGRGNAEMTRALLDAGADPLACDRRAGASVLHKAIQGGSLDVVQQLVEAGAFVDAVTPTTGHTPLLDALWFKWTPIVEYLLDRGAGLNVATHYGFTLQQHFDFELKVDVAGRDRLLEEQRLLEARQAADEKAIEDQQLMAATVAGDTAKARALIRAGAPLDARHPRVNSFNDGHTPLLVAARDGHGEIVRALLAAGADVNAVEPVFGAVPIHKSVYNGHVEITRDLARHPGVNLDVQGSTNGYTPLHDSIWHGYAECAEIIVEAGARLDLLGDDGALPIDLARSVFGARHRVTQLIDSRSHAVRGQAVTS